MYAEAGGQGPWYSGLAVKRGTRAKKQSQIIPHTSPHLAVDWMNRKVVNLQEEGWVMDLKIGPFELWSECLDFARRWKRDWRGSDQRYAGGLALYREYRQRHPRLMLWRRAPGVLLPRASVNSRRRYRIRQAQTLSESLTGPPRLFDHTITVRELESLFLHKIK